ncbi:MAG: tetratricopeptide repeat protein [Candidatus Entotheonellia bacterium]
MLGAPALYLQGYAYYHLGHLSEAVESLSRSITIDPQSRDAH